MEKEFWINKTIEEMSEVIQALCKYRNYGPTQINPHTAMTNVSHLEDEIGELYYCMIQMIGSLDLVPENIDAAFRMKEKKIHDYIGYSLLVDNDQDVKQSMKLQALNDQYSS